VLIVTLPPSSGGVPAKTRMLISLLQRRGYSVTVAYYATLTDEPELVATSWRIPFGARPQMAARRWFDQAPAVAVGSWLPELEFTYCWPSSRWREVIAAHDRHLSTGGTVLASYPLLRTGVPHMHWCASTMIEDRRDRRAAMAAPRRLFDRCVIGPVQTAMERQILTGPGRLLVTSEHTRRRFAERGRPLSRTRLMPVPVDTDRFRPPVQAAAAGVIGFAGRIADPRKNIPLLIDAFARARTWSAGLRMRLTGEPTEALRAECRRLGVAAAVEFVGNLSDAALPNFYRSLDIFVIPSRQEGFGIVGIEAMASGVPVISTRCGGPEDFVVDGRTGYLTDHDAVEIADRIVELTNDRLLREHLSRAARQTAVEEYSLARFEGTIEAAWRDVWQEAL
jgi:glycosyltransferase involved in cell wall biosynthesis